MGWLDLHMHSNVSNDGEFSPKKLMELCFEAALKVVALTDHNSVRGVNEAKFYAEQLGIQLIPAIELDCSFKGVDLHVLGYGIDVMNDTFEKVGQNIEEQEREASGKLVELVNNMGIVFDYKEVMKLSRKGIITGEMIGEAALKNDSNKENPLMSPFYPGGDRSDNPYVNFYWDICSAGKGAYVPIKFISLVEAINLICSTGGIPVLAHPGINVKEDEGLLHDIIGEGIEGIEVYSSYHSLEQIELYARQAEKYGLFKTLGSDFHGKTKPSIKLGHSNYNCSEEQIYKEMIKLIGNNGGVNEERKYT